MRWSNPERRRGPAHCARAARPRWNVASSEKLGDGVAGQGNNFGLRSIPR